MAADITITSPAAVGLGGVNWLGRQLIAHGGASTAVSETERTAKAVGPRPTPGPTQPPPLPVTCEIQVQNTGVTVANGTVTCDAPNVTSWLARFGPLTLDGQTQYQMVAKLTTGAGTKTVTVQSLYFTPNNQVTFPPAVQGGATFPRQFSVIGTYGPPAPGGNVTCYLMRGTTTLAVGQVQMNQPNPGSWTANFNVNAPQPGCCLIAELWSQQPNESIAAVWCDNVNIGP